MPDPRGRKLLREPLAIAATVLFLALSLPFTLLSRGERSAYVNTFTSYPIGQGAFGLFGYSYIMGDVPLMSENIYYSDQTVTQLGAKQRASMYFTSIRPMYAFVASMVAPLVGVLAALTLVNYLSWVAMAIIAWRFAITETGDRVAALIAVLLVATGLGCVVHIHDYSPHLFAFAAYYLCVLVVFESRVWTESRPLQTHLRIAAVLVLACLAYSIGIVLTLGYVLVAFPRNRLRHVSLSAALALAGQYAWTTWLNLVNSAQAGQWSWINVQGIEQAYLGKSLAQWTGLAATPGALVSRIGNGLLQFANFEFFPLVLIGAVCWILSRRDIKRRWFDLVFVSLPILVGLLYLNYSSTRGYLVFGISLLLYTTLAQVAARALRSRAKLRVIGISVVVVVFVMHVAWSSGSLWGYFIPAKTFFGFGHLDWIPVYLDQWRAPAAMSLTDLEPTPRLFGGSALLPDAGMFVATNEPSYAYFLLFAIVYRLPLIASVAFAIGTIATRKSLRALVPLVVLLWVGPPLAAQVIKPRVPPIFETFYAIHVPAGETWRYSVELGETFLSQFSAATRRAARVQFMFPGQHPPYDARITTAEGVILASVTDGSTMLYSAQSPADVAQALAKTRRINVEITARPEKQSPVSGVSVFGWQRRDLPRRSFVSASGRAFDAPTLPAFEMRLFDSTSRLILVGF